MKLTLSAIALFASISVHAVSIAPRIDCVSANGQISYKAQMPVSVTDGEDGTRVVQVDDGVHVKIQLTQANRLTQIDRMDLTRDGHNGGWEIQLNNITFSFPAGYSFTSDFTAAARLGVGHIDLNCKAQLIQP